MSTSQAKRPLAQALRDAEAFRDLFPASCYQQWHIAGSVRRRQPQVGDIEHVVLPRTGEIEDPTSLFAERKQVNLLLYRLDELARTYVIGKHVYGGLNGDGISRANPPAGYTPTSFRWGERYRGCDFRGFCHEVFVADADNLGSVLAIRTGPGGYSRMLVTAIQRNGYWQDKGYVWNKRALACAACGWSGTWDGAEFGTPQPGSPTPRFTNGFKQSLLCPACHQGHEITMPRVAAPDETTYFRLCGVPFLPPEQRIEPSGQFSQHARES